MVIQVDTANNYLLIQHFQSLYRNYQGVAHSLVLTEQKIIIAQMIQRMLVIDKHELTYVMKQVKQLKQVELSYIYDEDAQYLYVKIWLGTP
jgi:hypothetical protein